MRVRLEISGLSFRYGPAHAPRVFEHLNFSVAAGELLCLLGPNGTGKSTLLKCMNGLLRPIEGTVCLDGKDIQSIPREEVARKVGFVPQSHTSVFPFLVRDVVVMGRTPHLALFASPSHRDREIADHVMEQMGISHLGGKPCTNISGGEWQLVLIARALTQQPEILILDEPTSHLDMGNQLRILEVVHGLARSGMTVVMASHFPDHAFLGTATVAVLKGGKFLKQGAPEEVITEQLLGETYGIDVRVIHVDEAGRRVCIPVMKGERISISMTKGSG